MYVMPCSAMLCYVILRYVTLCYVMLCHVILCYVRRRYVLFCVMAWYDTLWHGRVWYVCAYVSIYIYESMNVCIPYRIFACVCSLRKSDRSPGHTVA